MELEPHYVLGLGEKLPTLTEIRNGDAISKDKNLVFGHIMETDRWLLLSKSAWTHFFYLYNKRTDQFMRCDYEKYKGFSSKSGLHERGFSPVVSIPPKKSSTSIIEQIS